MIDRTAFALGEATRVCNSGVLVTAWGRSLPKAHRSSKQEVIPSGKQWFLPTPVSCTRHPARKPLPYIHEYGNAMESAAYDLIKKEGILEGMEKGMEKGMQKGIEKGALQNSREAVLEVLEERFEFVPKTISKYRPLSGQSFGAEISPQESRHGTLPGPLQGNSGMRYRGLTVHERGRCKD